MAALELLAEVTGTVARVAVAVGDSVAAYDPVVVLESMKMEIPVCADVDAVVLELLVAEGDTVEEGQPVARLRP